ncbi:MAG: serine/threonine protein kinase [Myxococcales bacterium]|nr:serine/threonine protein kinase [Myxococcales bacterium]
MNKKFPLQFGPYALLEKIGQGGMAEIFRAQTSGPNNFTKEVAIKRILSHLSSNEDFVTQFLDEARIAGSLNHPNIVQIYDVAQVDNDYYIAMEFVDGKHLGQVIRRVAEKNSFFPIPAAVCIINDVAKALAFAHSARDSMGQPLQIIHRDVSPQNILISYHGAVKLTDFGIAKAANKLYQTTAGVIKGKFSYLAPEQLTGAPASPSSDIFALGITLWEMLCNRRLFQGKSDIETIQLVQGCVVPPLREYRSDADPSIEEILQRMVHRDPNVRYNQAHHLVHDLSHYLASQSVSEDMTVVGNFMGALFQESVQTGGQPATEIALTAMTAEQLQAFAPKAPVVAPSSEESTRMIETPKLTDFETTDLQETAMNIESADVISPYTPETVDESALQPIGKPAINSAVTQFGIDTGFGPPSQPKSRGGLWIVIVLIAVLLGGGGAFFALGGTALFSDDGGNQALISPQPEPASLRVRITPSNARMTLNGRAIDQTGDTRVIKLVSGLQYRLIVSLDGYKSERRDLKAREGETEMMIRLRKQ